MNSNIISSEHSEDKFKIIKLTTFIVLIVFLLVDFMIKIEKTYFEVNYTSRLGACVKGLFFISISLYVTLKKKLSRNKIYLISALIVSFLIGQIFLKGFIVFFSNLKNETLNGDIYYFIRYMCVYLFIIFFNSLAFKSKQLIKLITIIEYFLMFNSLLVLLGVIFDINLFRSYPNTIRFGYSGFFSRASEANYLYIIFIIKNVAEYLELKKFNSLIKAVFFIVVSMFFGTKLMWVFPFILFYFVFYIKKGFDYKIHLIYLFFIGLMFFFKNELLYCFIKFFPFWAHSYNNKISLFTLLSSQRNLLFNDFIAFISEKWNFLNYIFGGSDYNSLNIQIEIIDLYYLMGIPGLFFFFYVFKTYFCKNNSTYFLYLLIILVPSLFSGNLLLSTTNMLFLYLIFLCINFFYIKGKNLEQNNYIK